MKHILIPLEKYRSLMQRVCPPAESNNEQSIEATPPELSDSLSIDQILTIIPKRAQHKASSLLHILQPHLRWNDRGEIVIQDKPILNSHIADLVKYTVVRHINKRLPLGGEDFLAILSAINAPKSLIVNERVLEILAQRVDTENTVHTAQWHTL